MSITQWASTAANDCFRAVNSSQPLSRFGRLLSVTAQLPVSTPSRYWTACASRQPNRESLQPIVRAISKDQKGTRGRTRTGKFDELPHKATFFDASHDIVRMRGYVLIIFRNNGAVLIRLSAPHALYQLFVLAFRSMGSRRNLVQRTIGGRGGVQKPCKYETQKCERSSYCGSHSYYCPCVTQRFCAAWSGIARCRWLRLARKIVCMGLHLVDRSDELERPTSTP
jgi:hypothetical protein